MSDSGRAIGDERERQFNNVWIPPVRTDAVNHPPHYTKHPSGVECIQVTEAMPFLEGNIVKYVWRWRDKNGVEDLKKAKWYLERLIANAERDAQT